MSNIPTIKELNQLGVFSGRLSEVHVKNMEAFPFIYFNGIQEAKIDYEISQTKSVQSYVHYDLTLKEENDHMPKRFEGLHTAIKALFWKEIDLKLILNGKEYKNE